MNWYKKAQTSFLTWFSDQVNKLMEQSKSIGEEDVSLLNQWAVETKPDLSNIDLRTAIGKAKAYMADKKYREKYMSISERIKQSHDDAIAHNQNIYPHAPNFMVDIRLKEHHIPAKSRKNISEAIYDLGNYRQLPTNKFVGLSSLRR